jgi:hypothetical protein
MSIQKNKEEMKRQATNPADADVEFNTIPYS